MFKEEEKRLIFRDRFFFDNGDALTLFSRE
jgi:hypothetical protein